jgi:hypothetical protein
MQTWGFRLSRGWSSLGRFGRYLWWSSGRDELVGHILGGGWPADIPAGGGAGDWIGPESAGGQGRVGGVWIGEDNADTLAVVHVVICLILQG